MSDDQPTEELISVHEFANRYRVDVSVVRRWVKEKRVDAKLVGHRKMLLRSRSKLVRPIDPEDNRRDWNRRQLVSVMVTDGLDIDIARSIVAGMDPADVDKQLMESGHGTEDRRSDNSQGPTGDPQGTDDGGADSGHETGTGEDKKPAGPASGDKKGKGRSGSTTRRSLAPPRRR